MRVLITGHMGYIGPVMVRVFKQAGHFVGGLDNGLFREFLDPREGRIHPDIEIARDIRDVGFDDVRGFDCIVHLAALSSDPIGELAPEITMEINYEATIRLARMAKAANVKRFVFASSCSLYGAANTSDPLTEEAPLNPLSTYAISKVKAEQALHELANDHFTPVYMRNATAFGVSPGQRLDLVLNNLMAWAKTSGQIRVTSDGTPWRPLAHIEDISFAALCAAEAPREAVHDEAFNVGHQDNNFRIREVAEAVAREVPEARLEITGETAGDPRSYRVSFEKILHHLPEYRPQWTIDRGCRELHQWLDSRQETVTSFQSRRYVRFKQLKHLMSERKVTEAMWWNDQAPDVATTP